MPSAEPPDATGAETAAGPGAAPAWPAGPLSMSRLLTLEPEALRRLLTLGLRGGLEPARLDELCQAAAAPLDLTPHDLRDALKRQGWLRWDGERWRTRLGAVGGSGPPQS